MSVCIYRYGGVYKHKEMIKMENEARNTAVLHEVRQEIEQLPVENRIRIEAIARTLRNLLSQDPHAAMAFALVGAEEAAK